MIAAPLTQAVVQEARIQLFAHGYQPVELGTGLKRPVRDGWQHSRGVPAFRPEAANTGVLCRGLRPVDLDLDDAGMARRVASVASLFLGHSLVERIRANSPRSMLFYRAERGEPGWIRVEFRDLPKTADGKWQAVEILGAGQQCVVPPSIHPSGVPFTWRGPGLEDVERWDLPPVSEAEIRDLVEVLTGPRFGGGLAIDGSGDGRARAGSVVGRGAAEGQEGDGAAIPAAEVADAEAALLSLPCDYSHGPFVKLSRSAFVAGVRFEVFAAWCAGHVRFKPHGEGLRFCASQWRSFRHTRAVSARTLFAEVRSRRPGWLRPSAGGSPDQGHTLPLRRSPLEGAPLPAVEVVPAGNDPARFAPLSSLDPGGLA
jgi:Bifunctional DNA primase/polymerase, N-terminal